MQHYVYGTAFNNVDTIENTISSIYSSDINVVVVDAYSNDGTYEKLTELKKEYNLQLFRAKCSRGRGRDLALRKCPLSAFSAYVDFDASYNDNFKKILESEIDRTLVWQHHSQTSFFSRVDTAIKAGGFRDLYGLDTLEFILRTGVYRTLPVQIGKNKQYASRGIGGRERRYATGSKIISRAVRVYIDSIRSQGLYYNEFLRYYSHRAVPLYLSAKIRGVFRMSKDDSNAILFMKRIIETIGDHNDLGISDDWVALPIPFPLFSDTEKPERIICKTWGKFRKYIWSGSEPKWGFPVLRERKFVVYTLSKQGLENYVLADPYGQTTMQEFEEYNMKPCLNIK